MRRDRHCLFVWIKEANTFIRTPDRCYLINDIIVDWEKRCVQRTWSTSRRLSFRPNESEYVTSLPKLFAYVLFHVLLQDWLASNGLSELLQQHGRFSIWKTQLHRINLNTYGRPMLKENKSTLLLARLVQLTANGPLKIGWLVTATIWLRPWWCVMVPLKRRATDA